MSEKIMVTDHLEQMDRDIDYLLQQLAMVDARLYQVLSGDGLDGSPKAEIGPNVCPLSQSLLVVSNKLLRAISITQTWLKNIQLPGLKAQDGER